MKTRRIENPNKEYVIQNLIVDDPSLEELGITDEMLSESYLFVPDEEYSTITQHMPSTIRPYRRYSAADPILEFEDVSIIEGSATTPGASVVIPTFSGDEEVAQALAEHLADTTSNPHEVTYKQTGLTSMSNSEIEDIVDEIFSEDGE